MNQNLLYSDNYYEKFKSSGSVLKNVFTSWVDRKGQILPYLRRRVSDSGRLLDYGCGVGTFLAFSSLFFVVTGVEISAAAVKKAKRKAPLARIIRGSEKQLTMFSNRFFNVITCFDVLEHVVDPSLLLKQFYRLLSDDGVLVLSFPVTNSFMLRIRKQKWIGFEDRGHFHLLSIEDWEFLLRQCGLIPVKRFSGGFVNSPTMMYKLPLFLRPLQLVTQCLGLMGVVLPKGLSDVEFMVCIKNCSVNKTDN